MKEEHILISLDGPDNNVIKMKPPMVFTKENVNEVITTLDRLLKEYRHKLEDLCIKTLPQQRPAEITLIKEHRPRKSLLEDKIKSI